MEWNLQYIEKQTSMKKPCWLVTLGGKFSVFDSLRLRYVTYYDFRLDSIIAGSVNRLFRLMGYSHQKESSKYVNTKERELLVSTRVQKWYLHFLVGHPRWA